MLVRVLSKFSFICLFGYVFLGRIKDKVGVFFMFFRGKNLICLRFKLRTYVF